MRMKLVKRVISWKCGWLQTNNSRKQIVEPSSNFEFLIEEKKNIFTNNQFIKIIRKWLRHQMRANTLQSITPHSLLVRVKAYEKIKVTYTKQIRND